MRKHKCRAWNPLAKQMFYGQSAFLYHGNDGLEGKVMWQGQDVDQVLMDFADKYDKDGREIYQGDLILVTELGCPTRLKLPDVMTVIWRNCGFELMRGYQGQLENLQDEMDIAGLRLSDVEECVVIGNIFENPELMATEPETN